MEHRFDNNRRLSSWAAWGGGHAIAKSGAPASATCRSGSGAVRSRASPPISGAIDYNTFVRNYAGAGGTAVWLLSAPSGFGDYVAVPEGSGAQPRPWFTQYIELLNAP